MTVAVVLYDEHTRKVSQISVGELSANNIAVVSLMSELSAFDANFTVIITEKFILGDIANYDTLVLYKQLFNFNYIFVGTDTVALKILEPLGKVYKIAYRLIDYGFIRSVLYDERNRELEYSEEDGILSLASADSLNDKDKDYVKSIIGLVNKSVNYTNKLIHDTEYIRSNNIALKKRYSNIFNMNREIISAASKAEDIITQFEVSYVRDVYPEVSGVYTERPFVFYMKEYQEIRGIEFLVETIMSMFLQHFKWRPKLLRLCDGSSCRLMKRLPGYYHVLDDLFLQKEIIDNSFLVKLGNNKILLEYLLSNREKLGVLVILDSRDYFGKALDESLIDQYYDLCGDSNIMDVYGLLPHRCITNDVGSSLYWNINEDTYKVMSSIDRFLSLSSLDLINKIELTCKELTKVV
jgi:hypothetical protein